MTNREDRFHTINTTTQSWRRLQRLTTGHKCPKIHTFGRKKARANKKDVSSDARK